MNSELWALHRERRAKQKELMEQWDKEYYYPKLKEIQNSCKEHNFVFSHLGPVGGVWFHCTLCGKTEFRDD